MPEVLAPPAPVESKVSETDALKASFNESLKAQVELEGGEPEEATDPEHALVPQKPKVEAKAPEKTGDDMTIPDFDKKPDAKPEDKTEILTPEVRGELRSKLGGKAQESFDKLETAAKTKIASLQAQAEELRQKLATNGNGSSKEQEEAIRLANERAAELEQKLERASFADSPKFQRFNTEQTAEITSAKSYLEGTDINPSVLDVAASQPGQARLKTLRDSGMDAETIAAVVPHLARADAIRRERDSSLENWKTEHTRSIEQQRAQQAQQEQAKQAQEQAVLKEVADEMGKINPAFQKVDGHDKWNAMVEKNLKDAEDFAMGRKDLKELFRIGYDGIGARTTKLMYEDVKKKHDALVEEVSRLRAAQPGTGRSVDVKAGEAHAPKDELSEHKAAFNAAMSNLPGR